MSASDPLQRSETAHSAAEAETLPSGTYEIEVSDTGVSIMANQVYDLEILTDLAERESFEVVDQGAPWALVTLSIEAADMRGALGELLHRHAYQLVYGFDEERETDALKQVIVGPPAAERVPGGTGLPSDRDVMVEEPEVEDEPDVDEQVYLNQLLDSSPDVRAEAAENIEATGMALDYLTRIITTDPSPEVRIAAASSLEDSEDPRAVEALIAALGDGDPTVLVEVIEALDYVDDKRAIPHLQPFLDHPEEEVRKAAESALQSLE